MSLLMVAAALITQAAPAPQAAPPSDEEIVVIGKKLRSVSFRVTKHKVFGISCRITRSSGEEELDRLMCDAAKECALTVGIGRPGSADCLTSHFKEITRTVAERRRQKAVKS